jgi:hypothetical protein
MAVQRIEPRKPMVRIERAALRSLQQQRLRAYAASEFEQRAAEVAQFHGILREQDVRAF